MPVAAHHFAAWSSRADVRDQFIFFDAKCHDKLLKVAICRRYIREEREVSRFLTSFRNDKSKNNVDFRRAAQTTILNSGNVVIPACF
jgi:hypothetical protein